MQLARGLHQSLRSEGFTANHVTDAKSAMLTIKTNKCDLLILDLGLPDMDGLTLLKNIRQMKVNMPVLILTARDSTEDKIKGLDQGADDYISKPFDVNELVASNAIEVHIHHVHKKLPEAFIKTIRGVGYSVKTSPVIEL
ncbi:MAG: two-component system OmpR family response regulator [Flavobacteriales bacterium]